MGRGHTQSEQQRAAAANQPAKPIYVSVGHGVCLRSALALTLACCRHRVPEPVRLADLSGRAYIRDTMVGRREATTAMPVRAP